VAWTRVALVAGGSRAMLKKTTLFSFGWTGVLLGAAFVVLPACSGGGDSSGGNACTPNQQVSCDCAGGTKGVQVCAADGRSFETCQCGGNTGGGGGGTGSSNGGGGATGTTITGLCGNGMEDPGECDPGGE